MTIQDVILTVLEENGGGFSGTMRLAEIVPAADRSIQRTLQECRARRLIKSIRTHGGRGHKTLHRLTTAGVRYVLTQKGDEYVKSR